MTLPVTNHPASNLEKFGFQNEASRLVNQTQYQEIQGGQHIYM